MEIGLIDWYDSIKGYGVLMTPDNKEVFLHISNWADNKILIENNRLPIFFEIGVQRNKTTAIECKYFDSKNQSHWEKIFTLQKLSYIIKTKNYFQENVLELVLSNLDSKFDYIDVKKHFVDTFDKLQNEALFNRNLPIFEIYKSTNNEQVKNIILNIVSIRINKLSIQEILKFWREEIVTGYVPDPTILVNSYKEISDTDLKYINDTETKNLIILKKLNNLSENFETDEFVNFQHILNLIDSENFRNKIIKDLNTIAETEYIETEIGKIINLTLKSDITCSDFKKIVKNQPDFLSVSIKEKIENILKEKIIKNCEFRTIIDCWEEDIIGELDDSILNKISYQSKEDLIYLLGCEKNNIIITKRVLDKLLCDQEFKLVLEQAKRFDDTLFNEYDKRVKETAPKQQYFDLCKNDNSFVLPLDFLSEYLNHQEERYLELKQWIKSNRISKNDAVKLLSKNIEETTFIDDRYKFYKVFYAVKCLIEIEPKYQEIIEPIENDFLSLILWHFMKKDSINFETLKGKFIYFKPIDQVYIFKRLFYLKNQGQIDFDLNKLDEIVRADTDLYLVNKKINDDFVLDISTHVIIECLKAYVKTQTFEFESDLILKDLQNNSKRKFKIENYFDLCEGRMTAEWNWNTNGKISQEFYDGERFYYAISFDTGVEVKKRGYYGNYTYFEKNPNYDNLKEQVKKLPGRKWNQEKKHWGVPSVYKEEVYSFAKKNNFFIELKDKKHYDNNIHLVVYTRNVKNEEKTTNKKNIPIGITYCEGRLAKIKHSKIKKEFWWCKNQECFQNCSNNHLSINNNSNLSKEVWEYYTLLDFLNILNINVDEHNGLDFIPYGDYHKFLGHINAFNRLLERLYCEECGNLLYPVNSSHFALYRDVRFHCINENCSKYHNEIYLNHCLYGECEAIIDSRISKRCKNGLYICSDCGTCCSNESLQRRLDSLIKVGGYIHPDLRKNVEEKNGHLDKKEYYCYKCSGMMTEIDPAKFKCSKCGVIYDFSKFKWLDRKWIEIHRRRKDYPIDKM